MDFSSFDMSAFTNINKCFETVSLLVRNEISKTIFQTIADLAEFPVIKQIWLNICEKYSIPNKIGFKTIKQRVIY